jgi:hypothetical protein
MTYKDELLNEIYEINKILKLMFYYPNLKKYRDRWNKEYLICKEINKECNNVDFKYSCSCCDDAVLYAIPYKEINNIKIYSDPAQIFIGNKNSYGSGDIEHKNWKDNFIDFNNKIIETIENHFKENLPNNE